MKIYWSQQSYALAIVGGSVGVRFIEMTTYIIISLCNLPLFLNVSKILIQI